MRRTTMSEQDTETQWYIARDGKQHGPLTEIEMRTFVAHNYLRATDLIWRPGWPEWQAATEAFAAAFQTAPTSSTPQNKSSAQASGRTSLNMGAIDYASGQSNAEPARSSRKRLVFAAVAAVALGGAAYALSDYADPLLEIVAGAPEKTVEVVAAPQTSGDAPAAAADAAPSSPAPAATESSPAPTPQSITTAAVEPDSPPPTATDAAPAPTPAPDVQTAAVAPPAPAPDAPPSIEGSAIDAKLRKIPAWSLIKKDYPDWYIGHIAAAEKLAAEKRPESEIAMHLSQGLVTLRRQNSEKALAAGPDKLRRIATAFLDNLKSLRAQSVSACYGFISKGEVSPAVVQMMQTPESATALHAQIAAVFEAIAEGSKTPVKHEPAVKADYDILIKELGKLGWKEEDLQVFSNPRLLAKREPDRVCKMVQEWFVAHLAVPDLPARDRLLYETLKPVVSG